MKKILLIIMSLFVFTHISFAESIMPVTKTDVDLMVTELRSSFYSQSYDICRKDNYVNWDEKIIKASFWEQVKLTMNMINKWKIDTEKTRKLTNEELSDIDYIKKVLLIELNDPKRPSWTTCDYIVDDFQNNVNKNLQVYLDNLNKLSLEYKNNISTNLKWDLSEFESETLSWKVVIIKDKKISSYIKELNSYKAIIVEKTNVSWKLVWYYVFIPHSDINNKNATLNRFNVSVLTVDMFYRIYNSLWIQYSESPTKKLPVKKIGSLYYGYKLYK